LPNRLDHWDVKAKKSNGNLGCINIFVVSWSRESTVLFYPALIRPLLRGCIWLQVPYIKEGHVWNVCRREWTCKRGDWKS
jgi:hypothetical protein